MSTRCMTLAIPVRGISPLTKLILLAIADASQAPWEEVQITTRALGVWAGDPTDDEIADAICALHGLGFIRLLANDDPATVRCVFTMGDPEVKVSGWTSRGVSPKVKKLRPVIFARDGHKCHYCGATDNLVIDHKVSRSRGGTDDPSNLITACGRCNHAKGAKGYTEFLSYIDMKRRM